MSAVDEVLVQLRIVINFAVQHYPDAAILVGERLMATSDVNDTEAAKSQADARAQECAFVVRAAMNDRVGHATDNLTGYRSTLVEFKKSANTAHVCLARLMFLEFDATSRSEFQIQVAVIVQHTRQTDAFE